MGKNNKKSHKPNVFKVVGAKSLKKTKAKAKNIKQKVVALDKQFDEAKKRPISESKPKPKVKLPQPKKEPKVSKEDVAKTVVQIDKMDIL